MISFSRVSGDAVSSVFEARGKLEIFEHLIGIFESRHAQHGHFLIGEIRIRFDGQDSMAAQSLGDPDLWRALAFRGRVEVCWEDLIVSDEGPFDRAVTLSYAANVPPDLTNFDGLCEEIRRDFGALDSWVGALVAQSLRRADTRHSPAAV